MHKKLITLVLVLVCVLSFVGCDNRSMNSIIKNAASITGIVKDTGDISILIENEDGQYWVSLNFENKDSMTDFSIGDEVVVYFDGMVAESSPMQITTVYAIILKTPEDRAETTAKAPETTSKESIAEFIFNTCAVPVEKYENETYVVTEYRNSDDSEIYWTVVTINTAHPQEFRYDLDEAAGPIPSVTTLAVEADINFDGRDDLCIFMGYFGAQGVRRYMGYLQNEDGTYSLCKGFEEIPNPVLDTENKVTLASERENASKHWYGKYAFDGETVTCIDELVYTAGDETAEWEGSTYSVAPGTSEYERFIGADGEWDLLSKKWKDNVIGLQGSR